MNNERRPFWKLNVRRRQFRLPNYLLTVLALLNVSAEKVLKYVRVDYACRTNCLSLVAPCLNVSTGRRRFVTWGKRNVITVAYFWMEKGRCYIIRSILGRWNLFKFRSITSPKWCIKSTNNAAIVYTHTLYRVTWKGRVSLEDMWDLHLLYIIEHEALLNGNLEVIWPLLGIKCRFEFSLMPDWGPLHENVEVISVT